MRVPSLPFAGTSMIWRSG